MRKNLKCENREKWEDNGVLYSLFFRCSYILHRRVGASSSRQRVIAVLAQTNGMSQKDLQERLGIQAGSFSELALRLEKAGIISRERDTADRRRVLVQLTETGREAAMHPAAVGDDQLFHSLTLEEQKTLRKLLQKIVDAHIAWRKDRENK